MNAIRRRSFPSKQMSSERWLKAVVLWLVLLVSASSSLGAQDLPRPIGYVNDFAEVIDESVEALIESLITTLERQTTAEIAVVTVATIAPYTEIEQYGIALANEWGVGKAEEDNGVILLLTITERLVRIEVGYGLEEIVPDGKAGAILDDHVVPHLREGDYGSGMLFGVTAIALEIARANY